MAGRSAGRQVILTDASYYIGPGIAGAAPTTRAGYLPATGTQASPERSDRAQTAAIVGRQQPDRVSRVRARGCAASLVLSRPPRSLHPQSCQSCVAAGHNVD